ncbi:unnamed protein product [Rotaria sp. Silwood2]|nr:unnamed protein product [Rotaria sp. Silwood2]CAF2513736.1 unnamed protein product [Rotaria sp. Silwood2]CAF2723447.1 unnamed protein product [Rotaria sp. Silwood2]CAF2876394.1 unnamed protein product [Rotaria sp. Silwood2]CAF3880177.1 unnamed protein product [Rotaria sp. Silwood2]
MNIHIPKWILAALVGAAPMLGIVFFILFSCTLLGLVQRCKISLTKSYANRRKIITHDQLFTENENLNLNPLTLLASTSNTLIVSPFDDIPMKDIDAESSSKAYSEPKDISNYSKHRRNRSTNPSLTESDYDNGSSSIFNDNDYEQDRLSLIEISSQRRIAMKQQKSPDTIIHI